MTLAPPPPPGRIQRALRELLRPTPKPSGAEPRDQALGEYPAPYPSSWYRVATSAELPLGGLLRLSCLGEELVAFRGKRSGEVQVFDAHCPHQGADLGVGGTVQGDRLRCPFHHWEYGADGCLEAVPCLDKVPPVAVRSWPCRERHGMIWVFRHFDGASAPPAYDLAEHADIASGDKVYRGEYDAGEVAMHLIEFAENSVDFQHFKPVHGNMLIPWTRLAVPGITVDHVPGWFIDDDRPHVAYFTNSASLRFLGRPIPNSGADAEITLFGPGGVVWFKFEVPGVGHITMFQTHTPVGPKRLRVYFRWFAEPKVPRALVYYVVGSWISNWRADIDIWENKVYKRKPKLCKEDGPVHRMRKWYAQFYETTV